MINTESIDYAYTDNFIKEKLVRHRKQAMYFRRI